MRLACSLGPLVAVALAAALGGGCGPQGPLGVLPGGPLAGEVVAEEIDDWSFTDDQLTCAIETQGGWIDHSVTVLCTAHDGHLYVPSRNPQGKRWVANLRRDPKVRIGVAGRIYPGVAEEVTSLEEAEPVARAQVLKYAGIEAEHVRPLLGPPEPGDDRAEVRLFRVTSTGVRP